jgi:tetratricopeptide (TPR) repeat protein/transcriptional regulator with XRE-family HTH domain
MESAAEPELGFAALLRQLRGETRLTQEELAEASGLSPRSISDLERGINRTARKESAVLLAGALGLDGRVRELFVAAARGRAPAGEVLAARDSAPPPASAVAATRTLPRDIGSFTGREPELARLLAGVAADAGLGGIHAIDGMAGIGKTTLAVHAAHRLAARFPDGQFFLPLHAHTPGQQPVSPSDALASLLLAAGVAMHHIPPGAEARAGRWRDYVAGKKILLVLDDAAGHEQVRPLLPGAPGSLVLITSRRRLTALEDAEVVSIDTLSPDEAMALLTRLAGRADLAGGGGPAAEIARMCGYLPLAIGMLARQLKHHPARGGAELARDLAAAHDRLAVMRAENLSVAAAFETSYQDLTADQQRLFRRLGLAPGTDIDAYAAAALDDVSLEIARAGLDELYDQHLITEPSPGRYLLHDLLHEHARALAAADDPAPSRAAIGRLINYYAHVASAASRHIATWTTAGGRPPPSSPPAWAPDLPDLDRAADWLEAERPNLHAAVSYAAVEGMPQHAVAIATAMGGFLRARGHWDQASDQYQTALAAAVQAGDRPGEAGALDELGLLQQITGNYPAAAATLARAVALYRDLDDLPGQVYALNHLGLAQSDVADFSAAEASHREALALARSIGDRLAEGVSLTDLGQVQQWTGDYAAAVANHERALAMFRSLGSRFDEADALCELGFAACLIGDQETAAACHQEGLELFRSLGDRLGQAWAHDGLGLTQLATGDYPAAAASMQRALRLTRELGARHGQAVTLNHLGRLSLQTSATQQACDYHSQALAIARDLGAPLEQARALEGIGQSLLADDTVTAAASLRQALAIYQNIRGPDARRVQDALDALDVADHRGP